MVPSGVKKSAKEEWRCDRIRNGGDPALYKSCKAITPTISPAPSFAPSPTRDGRDVILPGGEQIILPGGAISEFPSFSPSGRSKGGGGKVGKVAKRKRKRKGNN